MLFVLTMTNNDCWQLSELRSNIDCHLDNFAECQQGEMSNSYGVGVRFALQLHNMNAYNNWKSISTDKRPTMLSGIECMYDNLDGGIFVLGITKILILLDHQDMMGHAT
jgi:hypothetical protein